MFLKQGIFPENIVHQYLYWGDVIGAEVHDGVLIAFLN